MARKKPLLMRRQHGTKTHYVYVLLCPDTNDVRYVGSCRDFKARKANHLRSGLNPTTAPVQQWIASLLAQGKKPGFCIVSAITSRSLVRGTRKLHGSVLCPGDAACKVEAHLIWKLRQDGADLLNVGSIVLQDIRKTA